MRRRHTRGTGSGPAAAPSSQDGDSTVSYVVSGMTCEHCSAAVRAELSGLPEVARVDVRLDPDAGSEVTVSGPRRLTDQQVAAALDEAGGYRLVGTVPAAGSTGSPA